MTYEYYGPGLGNGAAAPDMDFATAEDLVTAQITESPQDSQSGSVLEQGWEWFRDVMGAKEAIPPQGPAPMPGATPTGKPTAAGFSQYAREAAVRATAEVDEEQAPIEEVPPSSPQAEAADERSWIERYQSHITLVSTVVGLGTFVIWLLVRKK